MRPLFFLCLCSLSSVVSASSVPELPIIKVEGQSLRDTAPAQLAQALSRRIAAAPRDTDLYLQRGVARQMVLKVGSFWDEEGDFAGARSDFEKAIALSPLDERGYIWRAEIAPRADGAKDDAKPTENQPAVGKAQALQLARLKWLDLGVEKLPKSAALRFKRSAVLRTYLSAFGAENPQIAQQKASAEELPLYEHLASDGQFFASQEKTRVLGTVILARAARGLGDVNAEGEMLKNALQISPLEVQNQWSEFALEAHRARRLPLVKFWFERVRAIPLRGDGYNFLQALFALQAGKSTDAIKILGLIGPAATLEMLETRAALRARSGDTAGALSDLQAAVKLDDNKPANWRNLGVMQMARSDFAGAAASFENSLGGRENQNDVWLRFGLAKSMIGDAKTAKMAHDRGVVGAKAPLLKAHLAQIEAQLKAKTDSAPLQEAKTRIQQVLAALPPQTPNDGSQGYSEEFMDLVLAK